MLKTADIKVSDRKEKCSCSCSDCKCKKTKWKERLLQRFLRKE